MLGGRENERIPAAVLLCDPHHSHPLSSEALAVVYGLTLAEARVAVAVANGMTVKQIAKNQRTSPNTIRTQLQSVFQKVGVRRQSELVRRLLAGPFQTIAPD